MTSASELPLSHARSTILRLAVPPFHSFLPLSFLRIISSPLSLHPLDNLSLPLLLFFPSSSSPDFSLSLVSPQVILAVRCISGREREEGCTITTTISTTTTTAAASNLVVARFGGGGARRSKGTEAEKRGEKRARLGCQRGIISFFFEGERGAVNGGASGRGVEKKGGKGGRGTAQSCDSAAEGLADVWKGSRVLMVGRDLSEEPTFHR